MLSIYLLTSPLLVLFRQLTNKGFVSSSDQHNRMCVLKANANLFIYQEGRNLGNRGGAG